MLVKGKSICWGALGLVVRGIKWFNETKKKKGEGRTDCMDAVFNKKRPVQYVQEGSASSVARWEFGRGVVLRRYVMRTILMIQTLNQKDRLANDLRNLRALFDDTYSPPIMNMTVNWNFRVRVACSFHSNGIGRQRITTSVETLTIALNMITNPMLVQWDGISGRQFALMGIHRKRATNMVAMQKQTLKPPTQ